MQEIVRTNNAVLITAIEALLKGADIPHMVLDLNMSVLEGSLGILPQRILVGDEHQHTARRLLFDAGLGHELRLLPAAQQAETTDDAVLGGRLRLTQKKRGHRVGHDAMLLAAATAARPGDRVADLGAGIGAAGLALAIRVPEVFVTLIEIDPELAAIAAENIGRNGMTGRADIVEADITSPAADLAARGLAAGSFDRVLMNPPFNDPAQGHVSPDAQRRAAHAAAPGALADWIAAASWLMHSAGTLTLMWRADGLADVLAGLSPGFGDITVLPVHGRAGQPAIRVLVRAAKGSRAPLRLLPGLVLNDEAGRSTAAAEEILRNGMPLAL